MGVRATIITEYDGEIELRDVSLMRLEGAAAPPYYALSVRVDEELCSGCRTCERICLDKNLHFDEEKKVMRTRDISCKGCGNCVSSCPSSALFLPTSMDHLFLLEADELSPMISSSCSSCRLQAVLDFEVPKDGGKIIRLICPGHASVPIIMRSFELGVDGVFVSDCYFGRKDSIREEAFKNESTVRKLMEILGLSQKRIRFEKHSPIDAPFKNAMDDFIEELEDFEK